MVKKLLVVLFSLALVFSLAAPAMAQADQSKPEKEKAKKQDRWEGNVTLISKEKSTITVRKLGGDMTRTVQYDAGTQWVSQEHSAKTTNPIDASQVKEGDRVICVGTLGKDGVFHATLISKRLTPLAPK
ncbi:MAG TPA: hypothetical protein VGK99_00830 [Acidobacteriota bacterium]|jgi:hypothetical protein|nr:hypothetical protein [Candidatus Acidoferrales bacterium]